MLLSRTFIYYDIHYEIFNTASQLGDKENPGLFKHIRRPHPVTGTFFRITFADGKIGMVCDTHSGKYIPQGKLIPKDEKRTFVTLKSAVDALYRSLVEYPDENPL